MALTDRRAAAADRMRQYWEARARENAVYYVDTTCDYRSPDMASFLATGKEVVREALIDAPIRPEGRGLAVEIGCGLGRICLALCDHFDRVIGVDVSPHMVEEARKLVGRPNVDFQLGNGMDLQPVPDSAADFVVSFTVFQHLVDEALIDGYLRDAARVLRPGGVLCVQWNNLPHPALWKLRGAWWELRRRIGGPLALDDRAQAPFRGLRVPLPAMTKMVQAAGLRVVGTKGTGTLFAWMWAQKVPA